MIRLPDDIFKQSIIIGCVIFGTVCAIGGWLAIETILWGVGVIF